MHMHTVNLTHQSPLPVTSAPTQYDLGSAVKDGWTFTEELKMGAFKMPKVRRWGACA